MNLSHPVTLDHSAHVKDLFLSQLHQFPVASEYGAGANEPSVLALQSTISDRTSVQRKLHLLPNGFSIVTININAGATSLERRWNPDRFMEVAQTLLAERKSIRFFLTGNAQERSYVEAVLQRHPSLQPCAFNCAGLLTVGELVALLEQSSLFLTNDSGPMHLAASTGTPTIALFGPESPQFYGPIGNARVIYKALHCSPCLNAYNAKMFVCPYDAQCMKEITTSEVLASARSLLSTHQITRDDASR
jgi:ADP-heptose:LPS heptosyltransferase